MKLAACLMVWPLMATTPAGSVHVFSLDQAVPVPSLGEKWGVKRQQEHLPHKTLASIMIRPNYN